MCTHGGGLESLARCPLPSPPLPTQGLGGEVLEGRCSMRLSDNCSLLRLLEYPPTERAPPSDPSDPPGGAAVCGVSEHTDFELISVLQQDAAGLQLQARDGTWHTVEATRGKLLLIVGDMLDRLSSGYYRAVPHRVAATAAGAAVPRRSLVYFCALDEDAEVHALPSSAAKGRTGFADWMGSRTPEERRRYAGRTTQREWTEAQEQPAMQRASLKSEIE